MILPAYTKYPTPISLPAAKPYRSTCPRCAPPDWFPSSTAAQATQAFLAGNKALAKQLGAQGRVANEAMKRAHKSAADRIFVQRNSSNGQQVSPVAVLLWLGPESPRNPVTPAHCDDPIYREGPR